MRRTIRPIGTVFLAITVSRAAGQCQDWRAGPFVGPTPPGSLGTDGNWVRSTLTWDPDGSGPKVARLVVGGGFTTVNGMDASNIAAWNGANWEALGAGTGGGGDGTVHALAEFGGDLFAGGNFGSAGGASALRIARWDGSAWSTVGGGMTGLAPSVHALTPFNGSLIAAGGFTAAGGVPASLIARWDGAAWHGMGAGLTGTPIYPFVHALIVYNGQLIAAGKFDSTGAMPCPHIARWTGSSWTPLGGGLNGDVNALAIYNNDLIACGLFSVPGGGVGIGRWNGSTWQPLGSGVSYGTALRVYGGQLFVGGQFTSAGGVPASNIARWTGSAWGAVGSGVTGVNSYVFTLGEFGGALIAGGRFDTAGGQAIGNLAQVTSNILGYNWRPIDILQPTVMAFERFGTRMIAGGSFVQPTDSGEPAFNLAGWDGVKTSSMDAGMNGAVRAMKSFENPGPIGSFELVAGGDFTTAGNVGASHVARWVVDPIIAFPPPEWKPMGAGFNGPVFTIERYKDATFAGGTFTASGATPVGRIARWNGASWQPVGTGLNGGAYAMKRMFVNPPGETELIIGGEFTVAGGLTANRIARWTEGSGPPAWSTLGAGFNSAVRAVEVFEGNLYAAGLFTMSGSTPVNHVARLSGSSWVAAGTGLDGPVYALLASGGYLYATGTYSTAGGAQARYIARWNGSDWDEVSGGTDGPAYALHPYHEEIQVGGSFGTVRNGAYESPGWGRYNDLGAVWIAYHPESAVKPCGANYAPNCQPAGGYGGLSYQWRKNGVPLVNGPTGTGSTIVGANGNFAIGNVGLPDQGVYDCVITNCGGSAVSDPATLTVTGCCYANCTGGGGLTVADFGCFQTQFAAANAYADCNGDGALTVADFGCFQTRFAAGCP